MANYRVASYNVKVAVETPEPDGWERRVDAVVGTLRFHAPDIVGLQEPLAGQLDDIRDRLPAYEWVGVGRTDGDREGEFSPVGYRADRFDRETTGTFWLSETPGEVGSVGWDADLPRILTWVRLRDRETGRTIVHANTHFDHAGERARLESARLVSARLAVLRSDEPVVLTGDFNCMPGSDPYRALAESDEGIALADAKLRSRHGHHGPEHTFTGFEDPRDGERIDYVLVTHDGSVENHASCADLRADGRVPSDHLPVVADVRSE
jgi:endonuclease/exonuclease/phosphatase family metal-dependent hydrolase